MTERQHQSDNDDLKQNAAKKYIDAAGPFINTETKLTEDQEGIWAEANRNISQLSTDLRKQRAERETDKKALNRKLIKGGTLVIVLSLVLGALIGVFVSTSKTCPGSQPHSDTLLTLQEQQLTLTCPENRDDLDQLTREEL